MADPKAETIRQAFKTVIATVQTLASDGSTKSLTVESINRYGNGTNDLETVLESGVDEWLDESNEDAAVGQDSFHQEYLVFVNIHTPDGSADFDLRVLHVGADIRRAIMTAADSGTLQPLVQWVKPRGMSGETKGLRFFTNEHGEVAGVVIPFTAKYRTSLNNFYS